MQIEAAMGIKKQQKKDKRKNKFGWCCISDVVEECSRVEQHVNKTVIRKIKCGAEKLSYYCYMVTGQNVVYQINNPIFACLQFDAKIIVHADYQRSHSKGSQLSYISDHILSNYKQNRMFSLHLLLESQLSSSSYPYCRQGIK